MEDDGVSKRTVSEIAEQPTPGPWYLIASDGADFTVISTAPEINGKYDPDHEVLGTSEWIRAKTCDLERMSRVPEMERTIVDLLASLVAAVSLLKRGSKKAAPSDRVFDMMIADYEGSIKRARSSLVVQASSD